MNYDALREEFLRLLTVDGPTGDRRRKDYNQAIFLPFDGDFGQGRAVWSSTSLDMVLDKFDKAVRAVSAPAHRAKCASVIEDARVLSSEDT